MSDMQNLLAVPTQSHTHPIVLVAGGTGGHVFPAEALASELRTRGFAPLESHANFVCVPVPDCVNVGLALRELGVAVRPFPGLPHIGDALRISVGPWPLLERFLAAFDAVMTTRRSA